jgi:hypothetical protein
MGGAIMAEKGFKRKLTAIILTSKKAKEKNHGKANYQL